MVIYQFQTSNIIPLFIAMFYTWSNEERNKYVMKGGLIHDKQLN